MVAKIVYSFGNQAGNFVTLLTLSCDVPQKALASDRDFRVLRAYDAAPDPRALPRLRDGFGPKGRSLATPRALLPCRFANWWMSARNATVAPGSRRGAGGWRCGMSRQPCSKRRFPRPGSAKNDPSRLYSLGTGPINMPHLPYNLSETENCVAVIARTDPNEQESVVLLPELDAVHEPRRDPPLRS